LDSAANLAQAGTGFQERNLAAGQTTVMNELVAGGTTRPSASQKRLIAVEPFMTDLAVAGFNPQQHRLPITAAFSNTHAAEYSEAERREARGAEDNARIYLFFLLATNPNLPSNQLSPSHKCGVLS
jgi:hypothetical protein